MVELIVINELQKKRQMLLMQFCPSEILHGTTRNHMQICGSERPES
jgi:hypothetical protein